MKDYYVYILTTTKNTVLYIGVTNNLKRRVYEHKNKTADGFTKRYNIHKLVHCENCHEVSDAIRREKQLKNWSRSKKVTLIEAVNPDWNEIEV